MGFRVLEGFKLMSYTTPDNTPNPSGADPFKPSDHISELAQSIQDDLILHANLLRGSEFDATIYRTNTTPTNVYWIAAQYLEP